MARTKMNLMSSQAWKVPLRATRAPVQTMRMRAMFRARSLPHPRMVLWAPAERTMLMALSRNWGRLPMLLSLTVGMPALGGG